MAQSNSTENPVMKPFNWLLLALVAIAAYILVTTSSCATIKRSHTEKLAIHDTLATQVHDTLILSQMSTDSVYIHDTLITTPGYTTTDTITAATLHSTRSRHPAIISATDLGNMHSRITIDTAGDIIVTCKEDSLKMVIANLVTQTKTLRDSLMRATMASTAKSSDASDTITDIETKTTTWLWRYKWALIIAGIVILAGEVWYRFFKKGV